MMFFVVPMPCPGVPVVVSGHAGILTGVQFFSAVVYRNSVASSSRLSSPTHDLYDLVTLRFADALNTIVKRTPCLSVKRRQVRLRCGAHCPLSHRLYCIAMLAASQFRLEHNTVTGRLQALLPATLPAFPRVGVYDDLFDNTDHSSADIKLLILVKTLIYVSFGLPVMKSRGR